MVDFLLQDGVCEALLGFITLNSPDSVRPAPSDPHSAALKKSYRAVILLSPDSPTDALNAFLSKKASLITRKIFDVRLLYYYCSSSFLVRHVTGGNWVLCCVVWLNFGFVDFQK
jgi:hypothetical protein